jgi:radial spoke head protein 3
MYDRRVVRGNTFAALVIPVNMQPDPALIEKQKMEEAYMKQRQEEMRMRRQQEKYRHEQMMENQNNMQMVQMQSANIWEELSDHQNMVDEFDLEPDYYIDRAPDAIFIPNPEGEIKATQIFDRDPDLFDYENEVEPILQVLVGKSIEHARIEVIEEYEAKELAKHKRKYFQIKEAELMETQRLEENRARKSDEVDRRNSQMRITKGLMQATEKKVIARLFAKNFLSKFKRDTMKTLIDLGAFRRPVDLSTGAIFVPQMYNQIQSDMQQYHDHQTQINDLLGESMSKISLDHKGSIVKELNKRQERKKEEMRQKRLEEDEKRQRKERRAGLRERKRLELLKEQIQHTVISPAVLEEYNPKNKIYDVRDPHATDDGIIIIGGFVGELIITFTCLSDYILASPQHQNFFFTVDAVEQFLTEIFGNEDSPYPDNICCINLNKSAEELGHGRDLTADQVAKLARDPHNIADFGLSFMFDAQKELVLSPDVIEVVYRAICNLAMRQPQKLLVIPTIPEDADDDKKEEIHEQIEDFKKKNDEIEKQNAKI